MITFDKYRLNLYSKLENNLNCIRINYIILTLSLKFITKSHFKICYINIIFILFHNLFFNKYYYIH